MVRQRRSLALRHAGIAAFTAWATVWVVVRVLAFSAPGGVGGARFDSLIAAGRSDSLIARLVLAVPWPKEWAAGLGYLVVTSTPHPSYLLGHAWNGGRWWFFLAAILVKVPAVAILVMLVGPFGWRRVPRVDARKAIAVVALPAVALYLATALQPLDLGLRYIFPSLALWFVAAGPVVLLGRSLFRRVVVGALAVTQAACCSWPTRTRWRGRRRRGSRVIGGPPTRTSTGGRDSGRERLGCGAADRLVDLFLPLGVDPPAGSRRLLDVAPEDARGWVAVSATRLTAVDRDALSWLRAYCPVGTIGGSILLYRFDEPVDPRPGPTMPVDLCSGDVSIRRG